MKYPIKPVTFVECVLAIVARIPRGSTLTYKEVAALAGSPGAYRAVGSIMRRNYDPTIPCHRVVRSDGKLGHYNRGDDRKAYLLQHEGYPIAAHTRARKN